jgi:hypothetical protein
VNGSRPEYLFDVVRAAMDEPFIRERLIDAMSYLGDVGDGWMVSTLVRMFAQEGDLEARGALFASVERDPEDHPALEEIIELDGLDGLLFVADRLGDRGFTDPDSYENEVLLANVIDRFGEENVWRKLDEGSRNSSQIALFSALARERSQRPQNPGRERPQPGDIGFEQLRKLIDDRQASWIFVQGWGKHANDEDLLRAAEALLAIPDHDVKRLTLFLRIFAWRSFPLSHSPLVRLADSDNEEIRDRALSALKNVRHPDVRELGLRLVTTADPALRRWSFELLNTDPQPDDHLLMEEVFDREADENALHWIGMSILKVVDRTHSIAFTDALLKVYERGPCAFCRESVVRRLIDLGTLPHPVAEECLFDQSLDTREHASQYLSSS